MLAYAGFQEHRSFAHYLRNANRFWEAAVSVMHHVVVTTQRVIVVRVSNPFDSFLFGPLLIDGVFYFPRLRWFKDRVVEGRLDNALETNLKKWIYPIGAVKRIEYDGSSFAIDLVNGQRKFFRLSSSGMISLGAVTPFGSDFAAATVAFNRLHASKPLVAAEPDSSA